MGTRSVGAIASGISFTTVAQLTWTEVRDFRRALDKMEEESPQARVTRPLASPRDRSTPASIGLRDEQAQTLALLGWMWGTDTTILDVREYGVLPG